MVFVHPQLSKLTVPALKAFAQSVKIKVSNVKKADLVDAIMAHFAS